MIKRTALFVLCSILFYSTGALAGSSDIAKIGADATIEQGVVAHDVAIIGGDLTVNGTIEGDVAVIGGDLKVGPTGRVLDDSVVIFGKLIKSPGAEVADHTFQLHFGDRFLRNYAFPIFGIIALGTLGLILLAGFALVFFLIALIFTDRVGRTSFYIETVPWKSLFYGFAVSVLILPAILLLTISIIGIPVIPLFIIVLMAASLFGYATMCQLFGLKFFRLIKKPGRHMLWEVLVGLIIIALLVMIPFVGCVIKTLIWMTGLGATVATRFGSRL